MIELPREVPDMNILDIDSLLLIHEMAGGMSKDEILTTFSIEEDDLSVDEKVYFEEFYAHGKGMAIRNVVNNLVESTKGKAGIPAALAYLRRFAKEFEGEADTSANGSFSFNFNDLTK